MAACSTCTQQCMYSQAKFTGSSFLSAELSILSLLLGDWALFVRKLLTIASPHWSLSWLLGLSQQSAGMELATGGRAEAIYKRRTTTAFGAMSSKTSAAVTGA